MELMEAIRARRSYRGPFAPTPIPREDLRELLEAGALEELPEPEPLVEISGRSLMT